MSPKVSLREMSQSLKVKFYLLSMNNKLSSNSILTIKLTIEKSLQFAQRLNSKGQYFWMKGQTILTFPKNYSNKYHDSIHFEKNNFNCLIFDQPLNLQFNFYQQNLRMLSSKIDHQSSGKQFEEFQQQISEDHIPLQSNTRLSVQYNIPPRFIKRLIESFNQKYIKIKQFLKGQSKNIVAFLIIILMLYVLIISFKFDEGLKCPFTVESQCIQKFLNPKRNEVGLWLMRLSANSAIFVFFIHMVLLNIHRWLSILGIFQIFWLNIHGQYKMSPMNMGGMFKIGHIVFITIMLIIYGLFLVCRFCCKDKNKKIIFGGFVVSIALLYFIFIQNSCYFWKYGINGQIHKSTQLCQVLQPSCWLMYLANFLDLSPFLYETSLGKPFQLVIDKYIPNSANGSIIAFANSNSFTQIQRTTENLQLSVFKHTIRYKSLEQATKSDKRHEVILDNQKQEYHIKVHRNETLVRQRKKTFEEAMNSSSPPIAKNILFLFFDSISRAQAHLKLSKTLNWFKKSSKYHSYLDSQDLKIDSNTVQSYEFYRYNSVGYLTGENCFAMLYGLPYVLKENMLKDQYVDSQSQLRKLDKQQKQRPEDIVFFGKNYQDRGFITSGSGSYCNVMNADRYQYEVKSLASPRYDHQSHSFACDPNFQSLENKFSIFSGASSASDRNLYGKKLSEYAFEYALSFFQAYKDVPKLQVLNFMEGHDYYTGSTKQVDKPFRDFFDKFQQRGYSKDTVIILASDHGQHFDLFGKYIREHFHGLLVVNLPEKVNEKYRQAIRKNQQHLVTSWNIYHTMEHLLKGEYYKQKYMSLLTNLDFQKTCKDAKIPQYPPQTCACVM